MILLSVLIIPSSKSRFGLLPTTFHQLLSSKFDVLRALHSSVEISAAAFSLTWKPCSNMQKHGLLSTWTHIPFIRFISIQRLPSERTWINKNTGWAHDEHRTICFLVAFFVSICFNCFNLFHIILSFHVVSCRPPWSVLWAHDIFCRVQAWEIRRRSGGRCSVLGARCPDGEGFGTARRVPGTSENLLKSSTDSGRQCAGETVDYIANWMMQINSN